MQPCLVPRASPFLPPLLPELRRSKSDVEIRPRGWVGLENCRFPVSSQSGRLLTCWNSLQFSAPHTPPTTPSGEGAPHPSPTWLRPLSTLTCRHVDSRFIPLPCTLVRSTVLLMRVLSTQLIVRPLCVVEWNSGPWCCYQTADFTASIWCYHQTVSVL